MMQINFIDGDVIICGRKIPREEDGMFLLNELKDILIENNLFNRTFHSVMKSKGFKDKLSLLTKIKFKSWLSPIYELKKANLYRVNGRQRDKKSYCSLSVLIVLLFDYSNETFDACIKGLINYDSNKI